MFGAEKGTADRLDGKKLHIGIVQARFNESVTNALATACRAALLDLGVQEKHITHVLVPGAWTVHEGHELVERIETEIAEALPNSHAFTHLESLDDPASWEDEDLIRSGRNAQPSAK